MANAKEAKIEVFQDAESKEWRLRFVAANGRTLDPMKGSTRRSRTLALAESISRDLPVVVREP